MTAIGQTVVDVVVALAASSYAALGAPLKHEPRAQHPRPAVVEVRRLPVRPAGAPVSLRVARDQTRLPQPCTALSKI